MKSWCKLAAQQVPFWNTYICLCWDSVADNGIIELCFFYNFLASFFFYLRGGKKKKRQLYAPALRNIAGRAFALEIIKKSCKALIAGVGGCVCVYLSEGASRLPINHLGSSALLRSSSGIRGHPPHNATMPPFFFLYIIFLYASDICTNKLGRDALDLLGCLHCWDCLEEFCHANGGFLRGEVTVT